MKDGLATVLAAMELLIPIFGITRLSSRKALSLVFVTAAHLVPLLGCLFAQWDPMVIILAYWIDVSLVLFFLFSALVIILVRRNTGSKKDFHDTGFRLPGIIERAGYQAEAVFLFVWIIFFLLWLFSSLYMISALAQSHYDLKSFSEGLSRLWQGILPGTGSLSSFINSEFAALIVMVISSLFSLFLQFTGRGHRVQNKGAFVFIAMPLVRVFIMYCALATSFTLPAFAVAAVMAFAMSLVDQRCAIIDHDFSGTQGLAQRFATPHGALLNFGFQILFIVFSASFLTSSFIVSEKYSRIEKNPVKIKGTIVEARVPEEENTKTIRGGYWWYVDIKYTAEKTDQQHIIDNVKMHLYSTKSPKGRHVPVIHEKGNPRNAYADVPEERNKPRNMLIYGILLLIVGITAWWAVGRFFSTKDP